MAANILLSGNMQIFFPSSLSSIIQSLKYIRRLVVQDRMKIVGRKKKKEREAKNYVEICIG